MAFKKDFDQLVAACGSLVMMESVLFQIAARSMSRAPPWASFPLQQGRAPQPLDVQPPGSRGRCPPGVLGAHEALLGHPENRWYLPINSFFGRSQP